MIKELGTALRVTVISIVIFGLIYPLVMTLIAQLLFPRQANGSLVSVNGKVVGSAIIGQLWTKAGKGYDPTSTGGTNLGPTSKKLIDATKATIGALEKENPNASGAPPIDLVTSSASGIDPDISPDAAYWEAPRVAKARNISVSSVDAIVAQHVRGRTFGFLGEPRVNVLELNLALDGTKPD
jgi:K+-transporting ATPase ATPase C chain